MIVYLLSTGEYSDWTILGIYSTKEAAEADKALYERPHHPDWSDDELYSKVANPIQEFTLDKRVDEGGDWYWSHLKDPPATDLDSAKSAE